MCVGGASSTERRLDLIIVKFRTCDAIERPRPMHMHGSDLSLLGGAIHLGYAVYWIILGLILEMLGLQRGLDQVSRWARRA